MANRVWRVLAEQQCSSVDRFGDNENILILTRSEFFTRLRHCALREMPEVTVDELAPIVEATALALSDKEVFVHDAFSRAHALQLLHEGGVWARDLLEALEDTPHIEEQTKLRKTVSQLTRIESHLNTRSRQSTATVLLLTLEWLTQRDELPAWFRKVDEIVFDNVVDFCECELQIIFRLAELSQKFRFNLPFDRKSRGLLLPVQSLLSHIESRSSTLPIAVELSEVSISKPIESFYNRIFADEDDEPCEIAAVQVALTSQFTTQISWVCERIMALRETSQKHPSIAVAFRTMDVRARWFEEGLRQFQVPYRINARLALSELPEAKALLRILKEKREDSSWSEKKSLSDFLRGACLVVSDENLRDLLHYCERQLRDHGGAIDGAGFFQWLSMLLDRKEVAFASGSNADVVDLVSVKRLQTKKYDYVFLVDLAQGRFPKIEHSDDMFGDPERHLINKLLGKRVLPILYDDPLENALLPTKQAHESMWFVGALSSAQKGLFLSSSNVDPKGREQAPSEFLNAAMKLVGNHPAINTQGFGSSNASNSRSAKSAKPTEKSFQIDPSQSKDVFARWLGLSKRHPLTPTRLEAFASCPFRALVEKIFGVEDVKKSENDIDARNVGRFVHSVLEGFFRGPAIQESVTEGLSTEARRHLARTIEENSYLLNESDAKLPPAIIAANLLWLSLVLERAISNLLNEPPLSEMTPTLFEHAVGFGDAGFSIALQDGDLFLGGVIDRVDEGKKSVAVIDYKMSTATALRQKLNSREIFQTHFQLPLYVRLLLDSQPASQQKDVYAYLVSVRDGVVSGILGKDVMPDLKSRVMNDDCDDGLAGSIKRVMAPVLKGEFLAKRNLSCGYCHLKSVCRIRGDADTGVDDE